MSNIDKFFEGLSETLSVLTKSAEAEQQYEYTDEEDDEPTIADVIDLLTVFSGRLETVEKAILGIDDDEDEDEDGEPVNKSIFQIREDVTALTGVVEALLNKPANVTVMQKSITGGDTPTPRTRSGGLGFDSIARQLVRGGSVNLE